MFANTVKYHWDEIIQAFLENVPTRLKLMEAVFNLNPSFELREFRTLTLNGPRQSGKTEVALDVVRNNPQARFLRNTPGIDARQVYEEPVLIERSLNKIGMTAEDFRDVKILVIDDSGHPSNAMHPMRFIERQFALNRNWFDREFMVIHFL